MLSHIFRAYNLSNLMFAVLEHWLMQHWADCMQFFYMIITFPINIALCTELRAPGRNQIGGTKKVAKNKHLRALFEVGFAVIE